MPHIPQLLTSELVLTHVLLHLVVPPEQSPPPVEVVPVVVEPEPVDPVVVEVPEEVEVPEVDPGSREPPESC